MIRRFNFTGRRRLPHGIFNIRLERGLDRQFIADFDIREFKFPAEARLYFEASSSGSGIVSRFSWGTVATPTPPANRGLHDLPGENVSFTFKVVDESDRIGRILGIARGISPNGGSAPGEGESRQSLLPVNPVPLGQQVWRLSFQPDTPWLEVNSDIPEVMARAQTDSVFMALIYPAVVRQILTEALMIREVSDVEDVDRWESRWLSFGRRFHSEHSAPPDAKDIELQREWIDQAVAGFSAHYAVKDCFDAVKSVASDVRK